MDFPLHKRINRRIIREKQEFKDDPRFNDPWNEPEPDVPNPLPVPPAAQLGDILDALDELEHKYIERAYAELYGGEAKFVDKQWGQAAHHARRQIGKVQNVPINKLIAIEPKLYGEHLTRLAQGYEPSRGDKLPLVYVLKSGMYLGDGNHRVVNELSKGKETVQALVIDFREDEKELH